MAKALQSFSSCSSHQSVMYFLWWYKNILTGVGWLNEKASTVHILLLEVYARPQKMNPVHFFPFNYLWQKQLRMANAQLLPSHHSQCTSSSHKEHGCSMSAVNRNRGGKGKKPKKCTSRTDTCMLEGGRDAWSPLAYIIIQILNQKRIMLCIWVSTN